MASNAFRPLSRRQTHVDSEFETRNTFLCSRQNDPDGLSDSRTWSKRGGRAATVNGCPVNTGSDRWRLASQKSRAEGQPWRAAANPPPSVSHEPHRTPQRTRRTEELPSEPPPDRLETHPTVVAYTSRPLHAKTRIDALPCCRRSVLDRLLLTSPALDHPLPSWTLLTAPVARIAV
ncbi:hypothetical protein HBI56_111840 [Parastagonospora nodorum]|uniref:Uncharacterized protein n=1 Tax=Phaeosphaeria nodorum (strain SN15 / ATCC MYA-4574 / FGSC 10173) TaxID=321614 RepID=A0A7U2ETY6_PHANO|nr:hypothetical protein HBH56_044460 [Parastagonospora nodorum]QRC92762.1 hypothetical protein JI435_402930 [Parastagonospora nodorum SN15]KAH3933411.1 hypothetical protein HBH54_072210 [Parastagonospora nodorum]KAH4071944.1 hypothetical protein HBH50_070700 [Parastagonospora nodorum]KAH4094828.1 hypothetical protein HBH48_058960 [Parastagonospora nodorum]